MSSYIYQPTDRITFDEGVQALRRSGRQVIDGPVDITTADAVERIKAAGLASGMPFRDFEIDTRAFQAYVNAAGYPDRYAGYYVGNQTEKALEHFVALTLLDLRPEDVFVDIASEHSPVPEIYATLAGATSYSQDIMYPEGVVGNQIGGDACAMPVPAGFASAASLTCSLEHFEQDADIRLFKELTRVLRPGGAVCVVPFYVNGEHVVQTDPTVGVAANVVFDEGAPVYCVKGWGNRHARFYSPSSFMERIVHGATRDLMFDFYHLTNAASIPSVYARFAFVATRR